MTTYLSIGILAIFVILQVFDTFTTWKLYQRHGKLDKMINRSG